VPPRPPPASATERSVAAAILLALAAIAAAVAWLQGDFPPDKYRSGTAASTAVDDAPSASPLRLPDDAVALSAPEAFGPSTLSDKINGRAELYLANGFQGLRCRRFAPADAAADWIEACAFDMGSFRNAFAVFGVQRRPDGAPEPALGTHAYATSQGLFLAHGRHYVEAVASRPDPRAMSLARAFVDAFRLDQPAEDGRLDEVALFPVEGADPSSVVLLAENAFGSPDLDRVFTMRYDADGTPITAFLSRRADAAQAAALAAGWADTLLKYGAVARTPPSGIPGARSLDVLGLYETVFAVGPLLAGVHEAPSADAGDRLATRLYQALAAPMPDAGPAPESADHPTPEVP
jgi:hypothetical protein